VTDLLYLDGPALQGVDQIKRDTLRESDRRFWKFDGIPAELLAEKATVDADRTDRIAERADVFRAGRGPTR